MIKSYWLRILLCALGGLALGYGFGLVTPEQYDAIAQILVDQKQYMPSRAQNAAEESVIDLVEFGRSRSVETQVELLTSYGVLSEASQRVADERGLTVGQDDELNPINLQDRVNVGATKDSDMVTLRVRMGDPEVARDVAEQIYRAFDRANSSFSRRGAQRAINSLEAQLARITAQLKEVDLETQKLEEDNDIPDLQQTIMTSYSATKDLQAAVDGGAAAVAGFRTRIAALRDLISRTDRKIVQGEVDIRHPGLTGLENDLIAMKIDLASLLGKYSEDREEVMILKERIAATEKAVKQMKDRLPAERSTVVNPIYQNLLNELTTAQAGYQETMTRLAKTTEALDREKATLAEIPGLKRRAAELLRKQVVLEKNYTTYFDRLESLRAAETGRTSTTELTSDPVGIPRPAIPNVPLNLTLGLAIGLAIGVLWSVSTESRRSPIRTVGQLNRLALQPAYRQIPSLRVPYRGLSNAPAEAYEALLLPFVRSGKKGYFLGVLGVNVGTGATTTALNTAIAAIRGGYKVLLVETDSKRPISRRLKKGEDPGVGSWQPAEGLTVYPLIGEGHSLEMPEELANAAKGHDLVIFDFQPTKISSEASLLARLMDEMILLVQLNATQTMAFLQTQQAIIDAGCENITVVVCQSGETSEDVVLIEKDMEAKAIGRGDDAPEA